MWMHLPVYLPWGEAPGRHVDPPTRRIVGRAGCLVHVGSARGSRIASGDCDGGVHRVKACFYRVNQNYLTASFLSLFLSLSLPMRSSSAMAPGLKQPSAATSTEPLPLRRRPVQRFWCATPTSSDTLCAGQNSFMSVMYGQNHSHAIIMKSTKVLNPRHNSNI